MFIPTKSDGQIFVNLRKNKEKKNFFKKFSLDLHAFYLFSVASFWFLTFVYFFFRWDPYVSFLHFSVHLSPETNYFVPVSISFFIIEYFLNM